jgi:hypothetical protein
MTDTPAAQSVDMSAVSDAECILLAQKIGKAPAPRPRDVAAEHAADSARLLELRAARMALEIARVRFEQDIERRFLPAGGVTVEKREETIQVSLALYDKLAEAKARLRMAEAS